MDKYTRLYDETRKRIFDLLDDRGMNQKEFANKLNVSSQTITDWKKGKSNSFSRNLKQIACVLQTTPGWLFDGNGKKDFSEEQRKELEKQERLNLVAMAAASNEADDELKAYVKDILQQKAKEFGISLSELLSGNTQLAAYLGVTTSELPGEEKGPAPIAESEPIYPPEYDLHSPEDKALVDNMIRSLSRKQRPSSAKLNLPPKDKTDSETAQSDEVIDREVEEYRRRLILEKNQEGISSPSNGAGNETA